MDKRFFYLVSLVVASLLVLPAAAQNESEVTLSGNAYITAASGKDVSIDEQRCEIRNWNDAGTVISFYFRAEKAGKMDVSLRAKGHSQIEVSLLGKKRKISRF